MNIIHRQAKLGKDATWARLRRVQEDGDYVQLYNPFATWNREQVASFGAALMGMADLRSYSGVLRILFRAAMSVTGSSNLCPLSNL
jgi:hypothetical protein